MLQSVTVMPLLLPRSLMPSRGVTTLGATTWADPPPAYGLPFHGFCTSVWFAAQPITANFLTLRAEMGSMPSFLRRTIASLAASRASSRCLVVLWFDFRSAWQGGSQPGSSSKRMWYMDAKTRMADSNTATQDALTPSRSFVNQWPRGISMSSPRSML